jgi:DNA-directed RNA polymerase subunit RPC12/RpoP
LVVVLIKVPIAAIDDRPIDKIFHEYEANVDDFAHRIFPPKKEEAKDHNECCHDHTEHRIAHAEQRLARAEYRLARAQRRLDRHLTQSDVHPNQVQPTVQPKSAYFCTNCGHSFTPKMVNLLQTKALVYCEYCGQRFNVQNDLPVPQQSQ